MTGGSGTRDSRTADRWVALLVLTLFAVEGLVLLALLAWPQ
jgi:hypothetical protein